MGILTENLCTSPVELDDIDRTKMRNLVRVLIKIAKRLRAEELAESKEVEEVDSNS